MSEGRVAIRDLDVEEIEVPVKSYSSGKGLGRPAKPHGAKIFESKYARSVDVLLAMGESPNKIARVLTDIYAFPCDGDTVRAYKRNYYQSLVFGKKDREKVRQEIKDRHDTYQMSRSLAALKYVDTAGTRLDLINRLMLALNEEMAILSERNASAPSNATVRTLSHMADQLLELKKEEDDLMADLGLRRSAFIDMCTKIFVSIRLGIGDDLEREKLLLEVGDLLKTYEGELAGESEK